jgi:SAM-dependent methyltransferase
MPPRSMRPPAETKTRALFAHERVGSGYASARPFLHPEAFERVRALLGIAAPGSRALDVGCGTGMSSLALLALARAVVGVDASLPMLRHARRAPGLSYAASTAEALPFRTRSFDLVTACGSIDWVDRERFLPRAAELLRTGGFLVALDFGHAGRSAAVSGLEAWHQGWFRDAYPPPPSPDPFLTRSDAARHGFAAPLDAELELTWTCTAARYVEFLLTESSVIAAVEYGAVPVETVREDLRTRVEPLFGSEARAVTFDGYVQALRRL